MHTPLPPPTFIPSCTVVYWPVHTCTHTHGHIFVDFLTSSRRPPFRSIIHGESLQTRRNVLMGNAHTYTHTHVYTSHLHQLSPCRLQDCLNAFQHVLIPNKCNPKKSSFKTFIMLCLKYIISTCSLFIIGRI